MAAVRTSPPEVASGQDAYDGFVSYARTPDQRLAQALQRGLGALAKPWYRRRALRVFQDIASLSAAPELWGSIIEALERSRYFILLASPEAADSKWVDREVAWWREHRDPHTLLVADVGANLAWDDHAADFTAGSDVPPTLRGWFATEPAWTNLAWVRTDTDDVSMRNPRFRDNVAELAAPLRGMHKDELVGEDIRQHKRSLRLAWGAAATLVVLVVAAVIAAVVAVGQRQEAIAQRDAAQARALAALAEANRSTDPMTSLKDATQSLAIGATPEGVRALRGTLAVPLRRVLNLRERVDGLEFTPDGQRLLQSGRGGVGMWDLHTGQLDATGKAQSFITAFSLDASGDAMASVGQVGSVNALQITDLADPSRPRTINFPRLLDAALAPDGKSVALVNDRGAVAIRDLTSGKTTVIDRGGTPVFAAQYGPDGRHVLAVTAHGVRIWPVTGGAPVDMSAAVVKARLTTAGTVVIVTANGVAKTFSADGTLQSQARVEATLEGGAAISADGRYVAVGTADGSIVVYDLRSDTHRVIGKHSGGGISALTFAPGNRSLATAAEGDTVIRIWDLETGPPTPIRDGSFFAQQYIVSPRGDQIAAIEDGGSAVAIWTRDGTSRRVLHGGDSAILDAAFTPDGRAVLTVADDGSARLLDLATGQRQVVRSGLGRAEYAAISPDRKRVVVAAEGAPLRVWSLTGGEPVVLSRRPGVIYDLAFSADGRVAAAHSTRTVDVWNARGGPPVRLSAPEPINSLDFSRSGKALAAGSGAPGGGVFVWRTIGGASKPVLLGRHQHFVDGVAFSPDGSGVVSVGDLGPVRLWSLDGATGVDLTRTPAHGLAFDPSGRRLVLDGDVLQCAACGPPSRLIAEAREIERRSGVH